MGRLILIPQLPIRLRYQEWWIGEFQRELSDAFDEVVVIGQRLPREAECDSLFSDLEASIYNETYQIRELLQMGSFQEDDVLLHLDLSYPGVFHNVLFHIRPHRCAVFCHATALNRFDVFQKQRRHKWAAEKAGASLYDKVLVATQYHHNKIKLPNARSMGALPYPPAKILPEKSGTSRTKRFVSVSRPSAQKVDRRVEKALKMVCGQSIYRCAVRTWREYYHFLDSAQFLVITSKEETYGYQVVDAILRGVVPIAPRDYSYPELLPDYLLYDNTGSSVDRALRIMTIANAWEKNPQPLFLKCDAQARGFWKNLKEELTTWD